MKSKIKGCTHHNSKVLKMAGGGMTYDGRPTRFSYEDESSQVVNRADKDYYNPPVVNRADKDYYNPPVVNRADKDYYNPPVVNRADKDYYNPPVVNRAGKGDNENPSGVNRAEKRDLPKAAVPKPKPRPAAPKAAAPKAAAPKAAAPKATAPKPKLRPAPMKDTGFQDAVRRGESDEYLREKIRPKKSLFGKKLFGKG
jgi:hypothetical protein